MVDVSDIPFVPQTVTQAGRRDLLPEKPAVVQKDVQLYRWLSRSAPGSMLKACALLRSGFDAERSARARADLGALFAWAAKMEFWVDASDAQPAATEALASVASYPEWWARMCAADICHKFPELDPDGAIRARLLEDEHWVVRETAEATFWSDIDFLDRYTDDGRPIQRFF